MSNGDDQELWMDAQQYASLTEQQKKDIAAAVEVYEVALAAAKKKLTEDIAEITAGNPGIKK